VKSTLCAIDGRNGIVHRSRLVIVAAVALITVAVPVEARADKDACPDGAACVWDETGFQGTMAEVPSTGCIDAKIKSAINTSDDTLQFFRGAGCRGPRAGTLEPGQETSQISAGSATEGCSEDPTDPCISVLGLDPFTAHSLGGAVEAHAGQDER
jgi:Peptidase inhibitor family I36